LPAIPGPGFDRIEAAAWFRKLAQSCYARASLLRLGMCFPVSRSVRFIWVRCPRDIMNSVFRLQNGGFLHGCILRSMTEVPFHRIGPAAATRRDVSAAFSRASSYARGICVRNVTFA
jgi:hypothetical protein